jgi:hypothetical protein
MPKGGATKGVGGTQGRVSTLGFIHNLEGTAGNLKKSLGAKEHRLEAYATLVFRPVERSLKAILVVIAVDPR